VSSTDRPVPGPDHDEAGGEPEPAAAPSRARLTGHGRLPWAAGAALAGAQVALVVLARGTWHAAGVAGLIVVTLAAVAFAAFGGDG
jgi:hypothetical protein